MTKMNPEIKAKWVAALRSGEYKQATEKLRDRSGGFCCLGVLCKLYADEQGVTFDKRRFSELADKWQDHRDPEMPSGEVAVWSGANWDKKVRIKGRWDNLPNHNDCGRTFAEIADAIEAQL